MTAAKSRRRTAGTMIRSYTCLRLELLEERWSPSISGVASYGQLPLSFEPNVGQAAAGADFVAHGAGYALALVHGDAFLNLSHSAPTGTPGDAAASSTTTDLVHLHLLGTDPQASGEMQDRLAGTSNYFLGNDPALWHTNIPTYARATYHNVYRGVDLVFYGNQGQLEYDWMVRPGASAAATRFQVQGAQSLSMNGAGDLVLHTPGGDVIEKAPLVYQQAIGVRHTVPARYVLQEHGMVGLAVGAYDASLPLVIDPILAYSTYLGGSGTDSGQGIAVDSAGSAYVTGFTYSTNFPTAGPLQAANAGGKELERSAERGLAEAGLVPAQLKIDRRA